MAVSVTVIKLLALDMGVLCWMVFKLNAGMTTLSGDKPPLMPYLSPVALSKLVCATVPMLVVLVPSVSVAATWTVGDD